MKTILYVATPGVSGNKKPSFYFYALFLFEETHLDFAFEKQCLEFPAPRPSVLEIGIQRFFQLLLTDCILSRAQCMNNFNEKHHRSKLKICSQIYSGQYHHALNSTFPPDVAERLMEKLGYIHHKQKQTFFFHQQSLTSSGAWRESLMQAGMDFFLVHVRCSLASTEKGRSIEVDILRSSLTCSSSAAAIGLENPPSHSHFAAPPVKEIMTRSGGARNAHSQPLQKLHPIAVKPPPQFYSGQAVARGIVPNRIGRDAFAESRTSAFHRPSSRVETPPDDRPLENQYVYVTPLPSGGESSKSQVPWGHRLSKSNVEAGRRQRDAKLMSQTSEDHGDLYGATGPADCSVQDEAIRYPPADPLFTIPPKQISGPSDEPLAFTVRGLKLDGPGSKARSCYPPDVNYVSFLPNNLSGNRRPVKAEPSYPPDHSGSRPASRFERHNTPLSYLAMSSSSEPGGSRDVPRAGEYVHIQPPKRPGEVRHEQQQTQQKHIYHEIQDEGWSGSSLARPPASSGFRK